MTKRKDLVSPSDDPLNRKRCRLSEVEDDDDIPRMKPAIQPKVNHTYGQRSAFPDLDGSDNDVIFYGPASDGIEYLQMVR